METSLPTATILTPTPHNNGRRLLPAFIVIVLLVMASVAGVFFLSSSNRSTDTRSRAALTHTSSFEIKTRQEGDETVFSIWGDNTQQDNVDIRSFDLTIAIGANVLGAKTERVRVCLDDISKDSKGNLIWQTSCRGDNEKNCATQTIPLNEEEKLRYSAWLDLNKPGQGKCVFITPPTTTPTSATAVPTPVVSLKPSPTATQAPSPTPEAPRLVLKTIDGAEVSTQMSDIFEFAAVELQVDRTTKVMTASLSGRVISAQSQPRLRGMFEIAQIRVKNQGISLQAKVTRGSMKGSRPQAPGVEVELTQKPIMITDPSIQKGSESATLEKSSSSPGERK